MIVLDASVLLAFLSAADPHHLASREVLAELDELGVHSLTLAETLVRAERDGRLDEVAATVARLGVGELDRFPDESRHLARLRVATGLRLPDCCVLLAAESSGSRLATFDDRLARVARARGVAVVGR